MSVQSEIDRIITAVGNAYSKVSEKGGTVPASQTVSNLATAIDSIPSSGAKETWVIKSDASGEFATTQIAFTSNGQKFTSIGANDSSGVAMVLYYDNTEVAGYDISGGVYEFSDQAYRKLTFDTPPTGALLTWLQSNATKQPDDTAVQNTKAVTITSNGTVSVTPDAPYDGLSSVDVTVDVASGGGGGAGFKVTFPATAMNWTSIDSAYILLLDGTFKHVEDYSTIGGKTIENVVGIHIKGNSATSILRMTLSTGKIAQFQPTTEITSYVVTTAPNTTPTPYKSGRRLIWWPLVDTVISAIEMHKTA